MRRWIPVLLFVACACVPDPGSDDGNSTTSMEDTSTETSTATDDGSPRVDIPDDTTEIICVEGEIGPSCAGRISGDTWVTHLTRECDPIFEGLSRTELVGWLPGWYAQQPVPAIVFLPTATWPDVGFCQNGWPIELGPLENPRCGTACPTCIMRCAADLDGVPVMITPTCMLSPFELSPADLMPCP